MAQSDGILAFASTSSGPCLLFTLPAELRILILELALSPPKYGIDLGQCNQASLRKAISVFLVSKQMYAEAVHVFYRETCIDLRDWTYGSSPHLTTRKFLESATTLRLRQHVRDVNICLSMIDCYNCENVAKMDLESNLQLRTTTILIGPDYQYPPYGCALHPPDRPRQFFKSHLESGEQVTGPVCLEGSQFQSFLRFLPRPGLGKVTVKLHRSHLSFLCQFHDVAEGRECRGCWRGPSDWITVDHLAMISLLSNVEIDASVAAEEGCVVYGQVVA